ncbi:hypothetical protein [Streptomyces sp. NPDC094468]|uniref:hypothetical protein n=1 Tax=Streptomyces sp. NPDC094468 TaxID=3366066 RepID=UPI0038168FCE
MGAETTPSHTTHTPDGPESSHELILVAYKVCPAGCPALEIEERKTPDELNKPKKCPHNCGSDLEWVPLRSIAL